MLYCIMGNAGAGKDTICDMISKDDRFNIKKLITLTTRPQRENEVEDSYKFISVDYSVDLCKAGRIAEYRGYITADGNIWRYMTCVDDLRAVCDEDFVVVASLNQFGNYYQMIPNHIIPIVLNVSDNERYTRMLNRDPLQNKAELNRRFNDDKNGIDISKTPTACYIYNHNKEKTVEKIYTAITRFNSTGIFNLSLDFDHDMAWSYLAKEFDTIYQNDYYKDNTKVFGI